MKELIGKLPVTIISGSLLDEWGYKNWESLTQMGFQVAIEDDYVFATREKKGRHEAIKVRRIDDGKLEVTLDPSLKKYINP